MPRNAWLTTRTSVRLSWAEPAPAVEGKDITAVLRDGARIEARVLAVEPDALQVKIRFSSEPKTWPERAKSLPHGSVSVLRIVERSRWRRAALTPGVPALMLGAMGVALGSAAGGYCLGRRLDLRRVTEISIIPEAEEAR